MSRDAPIWLFDGLCILCSRAVRYTLRHERKAAIRFVAIQSVEGRALAAAHGLDPEDPATFLFVEGGTALGRSDGVLALLRHLDGPARVLRLGRVLPRPLRDWMYDRVARNRYRIFGKTQSCMMPGADTAGRFVLPKPGQ
ncbi:MAG: thiol-disulfide oxidoreductase DCC family protein [Rhodobacteraceae bacterium]|nr:thiol-disulfide oxidoreductase DCC family protein [Paracoccaceae bacterium]